MKSNKRFGTRRECKSWRERPDLVALLFASCDKEQTKLQRDTKNPQPNQKENSNNKIKPKQLKI